MLWVLPPLALLLSVESTCPSRPVVEQQLVGLLGPHWRTLRTDEVRVEIGWLDEELRVEVRGPAGSLLSVRDLARAPCQDLAAAAAVVIATAVTALPASPSPLLLPAPSLPPQPVPPPARWRLDAGLLLGVAATRQAAAIAFRAELGISALRAPFAGRLFFFGSDLRALPLLPPADVAFVRLSGGALFLLQQRGARLLLEAGIGPVLAQARLHSRNLAQTGSSQALDGGLALTARIGVGLAAGKAVRLVPFFDLLAFAWFATQTIHIEGLPAATLPQWDLVPSIGLAVEGVP